MAKFRFNSIAVSGIATALPGTVVHTAAGAGHFAEKTLTSFAQTAGILSVHRAEALQTTSDLGYVAAKALIAHRSVDTSDIGAIIFLSRTADYRSPATAMVLQNRLGVGIDCIGYDVTVGSTGFVYGIQIGASLLSNLNKKHALIITGDTNSKQLATQDIESLRYGDGTSAILLSQQEGAAPLVVQTFAHGGGFKHFIMPGGGFRANDLDVTLSKEGIMRTQDHLFIDNESIVRFFSKQLPEDIGAFLAAEGTSPKDYDVIAMQQHGKEIHETVIATIGGNLPAIYPEFGNTSGSSVPLVLTKQFGESGNGPQRILACAFGEGLAWGIADLTVDPDGILPLIITDEVYEDGAVTHEM